MDGMFGNLFVRSTLIRKKHSKASSIVLDLGKYFIVSIKVN